MEDAVKERADHLSKSGELVKDFHSELMMLRRKWRLKRTGTSIMGDLTYRSGAVSLESKFFCLILVREMQ